MNARRGLATLVLAFLVLGTIAVGSYVPRVEAAGPSDPFPMWDGRILDGSKRFAPRFSGIGGNIGAYLDRETGLVWPALPNLSFMDWLAAFNHCVGLRVGGVLARGGWRLPSVEELTSLLPADPPIDDGDGIARFWTATSSPTIPSHVYTVSGHPDPEIDEEDKSTVPNIENIILTWCVRGGRGFDGID
jgi:Protein of unknown function (DUF1566)